MRLKIALFSAMAAVLLAGATAFAQALPPPPQPVPASQAPATSPEPQAAPGVTQTQRPLDLIVTVTLATGQAETFAREIDRMEVITRPDGEIAMVHLILVAGGERNTHVWYNYRQVAKLSYRFVTAEGRGKVFVRVLQPSPAARDLTERLEPLSPREYR